MQAFLPRAIRFPGHCRRSVATRAMAQAPLFNIAVKGDPKNNVLADCEFKGTCVVVIKELLVQNEREKKREKEGGERKREREKRCHLLLR